MGKQDVKVERIKEFMEARGLNTTQFAKLIGFNQSNLSKIMRGERPVPANLIEALLDKTNIQREWLTSGEGQMMQEPSQHETQADDADKGNMVRLVPISAMGGSLAEFASSAMYFDCEQVVSPVKGADFIISVTGESMAPEYPSGSKVIIKKINERAFIDWGRTYVLDTCNGAVIKKIMPGSTPDCVRCVSINPDYPDFEVAFTDMYGMYRVLMMMCEK